MNRPLQRIIISLVVTLLFVLVHQGCSDSSQVASVSSASTSATASFEDCKPPQGVSGSPKTIEEAVTLINSLPKPVSVACFVAALDRPIKANLTSNSNSAQPAVGTRSPRIFIVIDKLNISVVPEGIGQDYVEFSYMVSETMSVKAELEFPIIENVTPQTPYSRIRYNKGTACAVCHGIEARFADVTFTEAFYSLAFQPQKNTRVGLETFRGEVAKCNPAVEPKRCALISAFFSQGPVQNYEFPAVMPYFF